MNPFRQKLYDVIFGTETPAGKFFDLMLIWAIVLSVITLILDTVVAVNERWGLILRYAEWGFTVFFYR